MSEPCPKCGEYHNNCFELKDLTDEEIIDEMKCIDWAELSVWDTEILKDFARAILRKAQEK